MMGKKRRLWMKWRIMVLIIGLVGIQTETYGQGWHWDLFTSTLECDYFYDPETVFRSPENIVRVWWKEVFKTKEVLRSRGFTGSEYEKVAYQINASEIDCNKKESRRRFFMLCSEAGENVFCNIHKGRLQEWVPVREEYPTGVLYWKLCR